MTLALWAEVDDILREAQIDRHAAYISKVEKILQSNGKYEDKAVKSLLALISRARQGLLDRIASMGQGADSFEAAHLRGLQTAIERAVTELTEGMSATLQSVLDESWSKGVGDADDLLRLAGGQLPLQASTDQLVIARQVAADLVRRVSQDFRARARNLVTLGVLGTKPSIAVMNDIGDLLRTQPGRKDKKLGSIAYQAERIVRTETNGIYNLANQVRQSQAAEVVPDMYKQWFPAKDRRVRPAHIEAGRTYAPGGRVGPIPFDEPYIVGGEKLRFPHDPNASAKNRINCRCVSIPYKAEWFE